MNAPRTDWTRDEIAALFALPFTELLLCAAETRRAQHRADQVQLCTIKQRMLEECAVLR